MLLNKHKSFFIFYKFMYLTVSISKLEKEDKNALWTEIYMHNINFKNLLPN